MTNDHKIAPNENAPFLLAVMDPVDLNAVDEAIEVSDIVSGSYDPHSQTSMSSPYAGTNKTYVPTFSGPLGFNKDDSSVDDH